MNLFNMAAGKARAILKFLKGLDVDPFKQPTLAEKLVDAGFKRWHDEQVHQKRVLAMRKKKRKAQRKARKASRPKYTKAAKSHRGKKHPRGSHPHRY